MQQTCSVRPLNQSPIEYEEANIEIFSEGEGYNTYLTATIVLKNGTVETRWGNTFIIIENSEVPGDLVILYDDGSDEELYEVLSVDMKVIFKGVGFLVARLDDPEHVLSPVIVKGQHLTITHTQVP